ncbi:DUF4363 family protein [Caproiciproducens faecalis]|uniref:DUF4363 family protein n=1 Tax=Caproiciproducens faecalis TaxID=2820301 RepID=A0ABS7DR67_9FIRM|nr:DUF4363 family protein [Caproiciproducens faecalis]MBW7573591.1 DUF4363 family protein [Caproiciproducens faecalis]
MKRLWACVVILVLLITICTYGTVETKKVSEQMAQTIESARQAAQAGDLEKAQKLSEKAADDWHNYHEVLCTFMPHAQLEAIDQTLSGLPMLCYFEGMDQFGADCDRGITQIMYLNEAQLPTLENIF